METPWGPLASLNPDDRTLAFEILSADKHQLLEGLVVENTFDQIIAPTCQSPAQLTPLDVETVIADTRRAENRWLAVVWARNPTVAIGLGRYLCALNRVAQVLLVQFDGADFVAQEWFDGKRQGVTTPLHKFLAGLTGRTANLPAVDLSVRDLDRQRTAFWGYLSTTYPGRRLWNEVVLARIFINIGVQAFFRCVWNLDRIVLVDGQLWMLEVKHKYPFGGGLLKFGINEGELLMMQLVAEAGIRCLYSLIVKPRWSKDVGSMYLHSDLAMRERAAVVSMVMDEARIEAVSRERSGSSPTHTSITGRDQLKFKSIPARDFAFLGAFADGSGRLSAGLISVLRGVSQPLVSDDLLRKLSIA